MGPIGFRPLKRSLGAYGWMVPHKNLAKVRDHFKQTMPPNMYSTERDKHSHSLSPDVNIYKLAIGEGLRIYDTHPLFVWHPDGFSNTWNKTLHNVDHN